MGCCSGRQASSASDMEPKPHGTGADSAANGLVNANAATGANGTAAGANGTANGTGGTAAAANTGAAGTGDSGAAAGPVDAKDGDAPKPARKSRSSSILKREHDLVWSQYFNDAIRVTDVAAELTGTKPAPAAAAAPAPDDATARAARLAAARKSMIDIVGREQVTMKSTLNTRLGAIFDSYDKNHSGDMDEPELRHVLEDYLAESKAQMAKLSESLFAADGELRKVLATTGKSEAEQATELAAMKQQFGAKMQEKLSRLEAVRSASSEFAKQLLADLDRNQDGHVSRGEFMSAFQDKVEAIVDA